MTSPKRIHLARIQRDRAMHYLFLCEIDGAHYRWYAGEEATEVVGESIGEALSAARSHWKEEAFRTVLCGFRYTLPERDEHGQNALYHQMEASYSSPSGVYFDEDAGHNCYVDFASHEALEVMRGHLA